MQISGVRGGRPPTTLGVRKLYSPCAIMWCCLRDLTVSRLNTIPASLSHADRQTDTQTHGDGYTRSSLAPRG